MSESASPGRAFPFHCPYCGDEDLRPHEVVGADGEVTSPPGSWACRSCLRAFSLRMLGMVRPAVPAVEPAAPAVEPVEAPGVSS